MDPTPIVLGFLGGLLAWTLFEYVIHYPLGHLLRGRMLISSEHLRHHGNILYFSPLSLKLRGALPVVAILFALCALLVGPAAASGFVAAVAAGWCIYEGLHQSIHVKGPHGRYSRWAARHHLAHHFGDPNCNYGVTTDLWDRLLGSHRPVAKVRVPRAALAKIPWLARVHEQAAGAALPRFAEDYELV